jgi:hypothetical protein
MSNEKPTIHIHDAANGTDEIREMTPEEVAELEALTADADTGTSPE